MFAVQCTIFLDVKYHEAEQAGMSIESITVSNIMVRSVKTAKESQTIKAVAKIMTDSNIGSVVIVKNEDTSKPVGIITERDIVRIAGADQALTLQMPVRDVMSKPVITIDATSSIRDALQAMELKNIRRLPVVDKEKKMVGIITDKDIFRALMKNQSLVASFCESLWVEYKPVYERLGEFMLGDMPMPGGNPK
ncbi:MAG TPA: CBS domain-containing protein [Nitrososphaera sp.]|nr:CBS domain-containing protein [Nitrososphaera sp.]